MNILRLWWQKITTTILRFYDNLFSFFMKTVKKNILKQRGTDEKIVYNNRNFQKFSFNLGSAVCAIVPIRNH